MATYEVADRSAIVTGGASDMSRAAALLLAENGASVLVTAPAHAMEVVLKAGELAPLGIATNNEGIGGSARSRSPNSPSSSYSQRRREPQDSIAPMALVVDQHGDSPGHKVSPTLILSVRCTTRLDP